MSLYPMSAREMARYCRWCGDTKATHSRLRCRMPFTPTPKPRCRVCGKAFDPAKSGREDCCYRDRFDS